MRNSLIPPDLWPALFNSVADGITVQDKMGRLVFANIFGAHLIGYPSPDALLAAPLTEIMQQFEVMDEQGHPFPLSLLPNRLVMEGKPSHPVILRFRIKATGEERWSRVQASGIPDAQGAVEFVVNTFHDITALKQTEMALAKANAEAEAARQNLVNLFQDAPALIGILHGREGRVTLFNPLFSRLWGNRDVVGKPMREAFHELEGQGWFEIMEQVYDTGQPVYGFERPARFDRNNDGTLEEAFFNFVYQAVRTAEGAVEGVAIYGVEVTEQVMARKRAEVERSFLTDASKVLASSLDYQTTLRNVAQLSVPSIADWCAIDLLGTENHIQRLAVTHVDPVKVAWAYELQQRYPPDPNAPGGVPKVLRTGQSEFFPQVTEAMVLATARDEEHLQVLRAVGFRSAMVVPLTARGRTLGAITLVTTTESEREFTRYDVELAEELGRIAGLAVDNANLYRDAQLERERFEVTLLSIGDAVIATNATGAITFMNPVAEALTGWTQQEAHAQHLDTVFQIVNETTRAVVESPVAKVIREGVIVGLANHTILIAKGGREVAIDDSGAPIRDGEGKLTGVVLTFRDITERRQAEAALHDTQSRLQALLRSIRDYAILSLDLDGRIVSWNTGAEELFGYRESEILGQDGALLFTPEDRAIGAAEAELTNARERGYAANEQWHLRKNGARFFASGVVHPIYDQASTLQGYVKVARDVTERKRMEERQAELLEQEQAARQEAERANQLKLQFLGMISHELRTPLTPIKGFATTLLAEDITPDAATQRRFIEIINEEVDRVTSLVDQLLDLSSLQAGTLGITLQAGSLHTIVDEVQTQLEMLTKNHPFTLSIPVNLPYVRADAVRIGQVIVNLVSNAAKYSPVGTSIHLVVRQADEYLELRVIDKGEGIPVSKRSEMFEAFRQGERKGNTNRVGAGLGLAICKGLVEAHGGSIWIEETPGGGTTVSFTVPIAHETP
jgi:PAS domain S-box-containing protein